MAFGLRCIALLLVLSAAGCGAADPADRYMGTWMFASGTDNVSCPNGASATKLTGNVTIKRATDGSLLVLDPEGCNFTYALDGERAKTSARSCSFAVPELGAGVTAAVTYDTITLATSDGKSMDDTFSGTVTYNASTGALDCVFSGTATLTKISDQ
jgi:phage-related minor tail protein